MYTVIGAFDDRASAQRTVDRLVERGFAREAIDLQARPDAPEAAAPGTATAGTRLRPPPPPRRSTATSTCAATSDEGFFAGVRHFLASLFGTDEERQIGLYSEAIRRGSTLVVVDARDQDEADRAAAVMREQGGTIDLDERSTAWRAEGWGAEAHAATGGTAGAMAAQALLGDDRIAPTAQRNHERASAETLTETERRRIAGASKGEVAMPVVPEGAATEPRPGEYGGVRVMRRAGETPISELVRLREQGQSSGRVEDTRPRGDDEIGRLARQAEDALGRATGDEHDEDDALTRSPDTTPRTSERGRAPERSELRRRT